jgi:hypothetical protein
VVAGDEGDQVLGGVRQMLASQAFDGRAIAGGQRVDEFGGKVPSRIQNRNCASVASWAVRGRWWATRRGARSGATATVVMNVTPFWNQYP